MAGTYDTVQKNLLVASDHAQQATRRLEYALNADERRDTPLHRPHLRSLVERQFAVAEALHKFRQQVDDGAIEAPEFNFTPQASPAAKTADIDVVVVDIMASARSHCATLTAIWHKLEYVLSPNMLNELREVNSYLSDLAGPTSALTQFMSNYVGYKPTE